MGAIAHFRRLDEPYRSVKSGSLVLYESRTSVWGLVLWGIVIVVRVAIEFAAAGAAPSWRARRARSSCSSPSTGSRGSRCCCPGSTGTPHRSHDGAVTRYPGVAGVVVALVASTLVAGWLAQTGPHPVWALVCAVVGLIAWLVRAIVRRGAAPVSLLAACLMVVTGGLAATATDGASFVALAIAVTALAGDLALPVWTGFVAAASGAVCLGVGSLLAPVPFPTLLILGSWIVIALALGLGRRQTRSAQQAALASRERELELREQAARVAIARDLHDVLAHTLGGLAIQLDAVDALLESGRADAAREQAVAARRLAGEGLAEARRGGRGPARPGDGIRRLRRRVGRRGLPSRPRRGASLARRGRGHRGGGRPPSARRALGGGAGTCRPGGLSNARRHAPGARVDLGLSFASDEVRLRIRNALVRAASSPGGGYGLQGMRERFSALGEP